MTDRFGDWMQTYGGQRFWPLDPRADEVDIWDIAHSLSMQCRYAGHCLQFYSVAEHCVHIARWLDARGHDRQTCLWGLLHDAGEAYVLDMVRPLKRSLPQFEAIERRVMSAVTGHFRLPLGVPEIVKECDNRILVDEKMQNMRPGLAWSTDGLEPLDVTLRFWSPDRAKVEFFDTFLGLTE